MKGVFFYTIALSIKGGAILWLPCVLLVICYSVSLLGVLAALIYMVCFNLAIALPYIKANSEAYFTQSFDFGRQFS